MLQYSDVYLSAAAKLRREIWATHLATLPMKDTLIKYMVLQIIQNIKHTPRQCYSHSVVHRRRERICATQKPKCQQETGLYTSKCPYRMTQLAHVYSWLGQNSNSETLASMTVWTLMYTMLILFLISKHALHSTSTSPLLCYSYSPSPILGYMSQCQQGFQENT